MDQEPKNKSDAGGGEKVFLFIILGLCVLIVILLLLMSFGAIYLGGVVCKSGYSRSPTTGSPELDPTTKTIIERCMNITGGSGHDGALDDGVCYCDDCIPRPCDECEDSTYPNCAGSCPDGRRCQPLRSDNFPNGGYCRCSEQERCEESQAPACTGYCPDGQICEPYTSDTPTGLVVAPLNNQYNACRCVPSGRCEDSLRQQCTGDCPNNQRCAIRYSDTATALVPVGCECVPTQTQCVDSIQQQCTGSCPDGQVCRTRAAQTATAYVPAGCYCDQVESSCENSLQYQCTGTCPNGQQCTMEYSDTATALVPVGCVCSGGDTRCNNNQHPTCGGTCNTGYVCKPVAGAKACTCVPETENDCDDQVDNDQDGNTDCDDSDCEDDEYCIYNCYRTNAPFCNPGTCPPDYTCELSDNGCYCAPEESTDCEDMGANECSRGDCPNDEDCEYIGNGECGCVPEEESIACDDIDSPNMCYQGVCTKEYEYCNPRGDGCACATNYEQCVDEIDNDGDGDTDTDDPDCPYCSMSVGGQCTGYCPGGGFCYYDTMYKSCLCSGAILV